MSAHFGIAGMSAYLSAKYALVEFTKILALELAPDNIRVNAFSPGMTLTPSLRFRYEEIAADQPEHSAAAHMTLRTANIPLGRMADPEATAAVACFLASKGASRPAGRRAGKRSVIRCEHRVARCLLKSNQDVGRR